MYAYMGEFNILLPEIFISLTALILLLVGAYNKQTPFKGINIITGLIIVSAIYLLFNKVPQEEIWAFNKLFKINALIYNLKLLLLVSVAVFIVLYKGQKFLESSMLRAFEFPVVMLFSVVGMMLMLSANNFLSFYVSLELQSLCLYILAAFERENSKSSEAGLKYFVLGSFASGLLLFGISLVYGFTGNLDFDSLKNLLSASSSASVAIGIIVGIILILIGLFFKVSAAPFHMWTPDVYQGAPTIVTSFFASIVKIATIGFLYKLSAQVLNNWKLDLQPVLIFVTIASLMIGAIGGLRQTNIKRLLAYSSISHVGFILLAVSAFTLDNSVFIYLAVYMSMTIATFGIIMGIEQQDKQIEDIYDLSGLSKDQPIIAFCLAILMFSLAGIPPFAGFFAKFYVLQTAMKSDLYTTIIVSLISAIISAYYYLRVVKIMYLDENICLSPRKININCSNAIVILLLLLFNLFYILL